MKFSKEEISLCKQVAERYRKDLEEDCLVLGTHLSGEEFIGRYTEDISPDEICIGFCSTAKTTKPIIPLWTISDCLEFLRERGMYLESLCQIDECEYMCAICEIDDLGLVKGASSSFEGNTMLKACLKAVLAVLEEESK